MSPQDIFASQMWPWPDPALKRDSMGRVLFMNAAFLQLYGGRIEDWQGNVISGWPAPQPPGIPYRFETRMPVEGQENIYDWIEYTLADGTAMALARNVTHLQAPNDPMPGDVAPAPDQQAKNVDAFTAPPLAAAAATASLNQESIQAEQATQMQPAAPAPLASTTPHLDVPEITVPEIDVPDLNLEAPYTPETVDSVQENIPAVIEPAMDLAAAPDAIADVAVAPEQEYSQVPDAPLTQAPETPAPEIAAQETPAAPERAYERRALPIEDESAVLGNNWRDAVIAKAVGAEPAVEAETLQTEEVDQPAEASQSGDSPVRILLAEDNAINALLTRTLLEAEGHVVETVEDGLLAVEAMKTSSYDLIFMDMRMPNMDGLEATRKIRGLSNVSKGLPIIALTANAFDDDRNACFDSGMNDFMTKPVSAEELSEMVKTWTKNLAERNAA